MSQSVTSGPEALELMICIKIHPVRALPTVLNILILMYEKGIDTRQGRTLGQVFIYGVSLSTLLDEETEVQKGQITELTLAT